MSKDQKPLPIPLFDNLKFLQETTSHQIIPYPKDYELAQRFLYSYRGSEATFNSYRREIERLLHWCWQEKKSLKDIRREDFEKFIEFCQKPPLHWIGTKQVDRFIEKEGLRIPNPSWRLFVATISKTERREGDKPSPKEYQLSQKALQAIFSVASSFYNYLLQEDYVAFNPVAQIRQKSKFIRKFQSAPVIRRLSQDQWRYVIETADQLAQQNPTHERTFFIMNALYGMYLRISELAASSRWIPQMGHFHKDADGCWWFTTVGKGNKQRLIAVSDSMLEALKRYRKSLNLTALPVLGEQIPLIERNKGKGPVSSTRHIRDIVQDCFDAAYERMVQDGKKEEAQELKFATVHWLRHTGISDDVKDRPREHVRDDAGHSSSAITDKYIDVELRARHKSAKDKKIYSESESP